MPLTSSTQYADATQFQQLACTPAAYDNFEAGSPGCVVLALQAASAEADSYLAGQFQLPLATWDLALARAVCWIAAKGLYDEFGYNALAPVDQLIERRYEQAIEWLTKVGNEELFPQYADASGSTTPAGDFVVSDPAVGFTSRGVGNVVGSGSDWPWGW